MGSLNGRIRRLEERHGMSGDLQERTQRIEEMRADVMARLQRVIDQEEQGEPIDPRRQAALEELEEAIRRRRERES